MRAPTQTFDQYFQTLVEELVPLQEALGTAPREARQEATEDAAALLLAAALSRKDQALVRQAARRLLQRMTAAEYLRLSEHYAAESEHPVLARVFRDRMEHIVISIADAPTTVPLRRQRQFAQHLRQWSHEEVNARLTQALQDRGEE